MLEDFIALSGVLTGNKELDRTIAQQYLLKISADVHGHKLGDLLRTFREIKAAGGDVVKGISQRIMNDETLGPLAQQIIVLWYTSALHRKDNKGNDVWDFSNDPNEYFSGLIWSVIHAHPLGLSGGYFGHWKYPPEN
jgi:hypothetical protein